MSEKVTYKVNISGGTIVGPGKGLTKSWPVEKTDFRIVGGHIGEVFEGIKIGLPGYMFKITGGSDNSGIPMRPDVHGGVKKQLLLRGGVGFHPDRKGLRRRKTIRGNVITENMSQINVVVTEYGKENIFKDVEPVVVKEKKKTEKKVKRVRKKSAKAGSTAASAPTATKKKSTKATKAAKN